MVGCTSVPVFFYKPEAVGCTSVPVVDLLSLFLLHPRPPPTSYMYHPRHPPTPPPPYTPLPPPNFRINGTGTLGYSKTQRNRFNKNLRQLETEAALEEKRDQYERGVVRIEELEDVFAQKEAECA